MNRLALLMAFAGVLGCSRASQEQVDAACGGCPDGTVCDRDAGACASALPLGAACGSLADGGEAPGLCAPGSSCTNVGAGANRCAQDCTAGSGCTGGRTCYARPGAPIGSPSFCAATALAGEPCDPQALVRCGGDNLACVAFEAGQSAGKCFKYCDPRLADPNPECAALESCADLFPDPSVGVCVVPPGAYPNRCDYAQLAFCGRGALCVRPTSASFGYCHPRCARGADCPTGQACMSAASQNAFCAAPVAQCPPGDIAQCQRCAAEEDRYCADAELCITVDPLSVCKQDCSGAGRTCAEGSQCTEIGSSGRSACL